MTTEATSPVAGEIPEKERSAGPIGVSPEGADSGAGKDSASASRQSDSEPDLPNARQAEVEAFKAPIGGDDSIQTFGSEAGATEADELVAAMRSFLRVLAAADHAGICARLTQESVEQIEQMSEQGEECPVVLAEFMAPRRSVEGELLRAANGRIYQVRVEGDTAFVLFTPEGGKASFFVMKLDDGEWKSTGIAPGTPLSTTP